MGIFSVFPQQSSQLQENFHIVISLQEQVARLQEVRNTVYILSRIQVERFPSCLTFYREIPLFSGAVKAASKGKSEFRFVTNCRIRT